MINVAKTKQNREEREKLLAAAVKVRKGFYSINIENLN